MIRQVLRRPLGAVCVAYLLLVVVACLAAPLLAPTGPLEQDLTSVLTTPSPGRLLGTDQLGRDVLSRLLYGGRVSLAAVASALVVFLVVGVSAGLVAGYHGGRTDRVVMRLCDLVMSIPAILILLVVLAIFSRNETAAMVTFGLLASAGLTRVVRASTLAVRTELYIAAARTAGLSTTAILVRHVLPRVTGAITIQTSLLASVALLVESGLNFLGLGVQPPEPSWGGLVADASQAISRQMWLLVPSGGILVLTTLALGLLGGVVSDATTERSGRGGGLPSWRRMHTRVLQGSSPHPAAPDALLSVHGLRVDVAGRDGSVCLVDGVDLDVAPGEAVGVVGESGCGKTMTALAVLRLLPPGGRVSADACHFDGTDLLALTEKQMAGLRGAGIGYIGQEPVATLDPLFTVGAQLAESVRRHDGVGRADAARRVQELLQMVRLPEPERVARKYPHELSGGMAQRVSIARALAGRPRLLVADEPTTALDVTVQAEILDLLRDLRVQYGMALVLVTHDWGVLADACDRAVVLYAGQVVESGPLRDLFHRPRHPYTAALLGASPSIAAPRGRLQAIPGMVPPPGQWPVGCRFAARCAVASDDCRVLPVDLRPETDEHAHRCLHPERLLERIDHASTAP